MARRKKHDVVCTEFLRRTVVHNNVECPGEYYGDVWQLTTLGAGILLEVLATLLQMCARSFDD